MAKDLVEIKVDDKQLRRMARQLGVARKQIPKVLVRALRKTATQTRTIIKNTVRGKVPELPASRVHKKTYINPKATTSKLSTIVNIFLSTIPLKMIKGVRGKGRYRGAKAKQSYITWKGQSFPNAFRATMPSGHMGIFMRKYADGSKPILTWNAKILGGGDLAKGLPIQELGASVGDVYHNAPGVKASIDKQASEKLRVNIVSQFNRLIK